MLSASDFVNIFLPVISHWLIWVLFVIACIIIVSLYLYPYTKKEKDKPRFPHIEIPITAIITLYIFTKLYEGITYNGAILKVDAWFNAFAVNLQSPFLNNIAFFITSFGTGIPIYLLLIVTIGVLLLRKRWRFALLSIVAILGATILQFIIKNVVGRSRPTNSLEVISPGAFSASFPSGHAITAAVYVSLLIYSYKDDIKNLPAKYVLVTLAATFFIIVGLSRIYLNAHWFSDVIAGLSLGLFFFMFVVLVERSITGLIQSVRRETKEAEPIVPPKIPTKIVKTAKKIIPKK